MKTLLLFVVMGACAAAAIGAGLYLWTSLSDVELSFHGYLALILGTSLTLILGIGLMALVFYSARRGHDDSVGGPTL